MWWYGIPSNLRGKVWNMAMTNELNITPELYQIFYGYAQQAREQKSKKGLGRESSAQLIPLDLPRTFPALSFFNKDGPHYIQLRNVLEAYVCYRPDMGYVQGMSYVGAVLMLNFDEFSAFRCLSNMLNKPSFIAFYMMEVDEMQKYFGVVENVMEKEIPKLYNHFIEQEITPNMYIIDWTLTMFSKSLPLDVAARTWDLFFLEGDSFIFRASLGILKYFEPVLLNGTYDENLRLLTHLPDVDEEELFACIEKN